jgi:DNA polymerase-3 subunit gamma/tau
MNYQVLARKWRPRNFSEMVGQEHVLRALMNALDHDRLHHAYLFTGTRGVGKTSLARILARSLNCERGISSRPCGECSACREIDEGRFVDLIEVDAASRTKVEDTRELLENVQYAPTRGRFKVYLVDEVHMLSAHSFNALLKTLEEPPPHVKFLLATTDPQRLPVTILSRCLQFNLKCLPAARIVEHLRDVLGREHIAFDDGGLRLLAQAAEGSMRDALSLLDQAIAFGGGAVREAEVRAMLGTIDRGQAYALLRGLGAGDGAAVLGEVARLSAQVPDYAGLLADLLSVLQRIAVAQVVPGAIDESLDDGKEIMELAASLPAEDVQLFYQIGLIGRRDLPLAPDARGGLEMVLLRMLAFRPVSSEAASAGVPAPPAPPADVSRPRGTGEGAAGQPASRTPEVPVTAVRAPGEPASTGNAGSPVEDWERVIGCLELKGIVREFANNCALRGRDGDTFHLGLDPAHIHLRSPAREKQLRDALSRFYGTDVHLRVDADAGGPTTPSQTQARRQRERQAQAVKAIEDDENIKTLQEMFDARVNWESITPRD